MGKKRTNEVELHNGDGEPVAVVEVRGNGTHDCGHTCCDGSPEALMSHPLADPSECPACERVRSGEPALGVPADEALTEDEQEVIVKMLNGVRLRPNTWQAIADKIGDGRLFIRRGE